MIRTPLEGLIAAPFTAMKAEGADGTPGTALDLDAIPRQAEHLVRHGVRGAFVCGTTGESASLTVAERCAIAERWVQAASEDLRVIVHVGHNCLADAKTLAAHAQSIGAHATAAMAPTFFKPSGVEELTRWCAQVASAAPGLPFFYYHIPAMTGVSIPAARFLEQAGPRVPNLCGVKFTHEDLMDFTEARAVDGGRFDVLFGRDEILLAALSLGARGAVGSTYNFAAPIYHRLITAFEAGDLDAARRHQRLAVEVIRVMLRFGGLAGGKAIMKMVGIDCGPPRLPIRPLSPQQERELREGLERVGFFEAVAVQRDAAAAGGVR